MDTVAAYQDFTARLKLLVGKHPALITTALSNIFTMRLIGNKMHGDLAEPAFAALRRALEGKLGGRTGTRHFIRVLQLLGRHPIPRVECAIRDCCHRGVSDASSIEAAVEQLAAHDAIPANPIPGMPPITVPPPPDLNHFNRLLPKPGKETLPMTPPTALLPRANLKQRKLPTMLAECEKLAREAAANNESYESYLLRLTERDVAARAAHTLATRIHAADFPVAQDFDTCDFSALPGLPKQKVLKLARGERVYQRFNIFMIVNSVTGKTRLATALGLAACRQGKRVRFFTAAGLVHQLEEAQHGHRLDRLLGELDRADLLICDELGYLTFSRAGAELLFQVFADRYERRSLFLTSNLAFSEWGQVFQGERMTAALLDRLTHRCHIFEMNGESFRFRESMTAKKETPKKGK